MTEKLITTQALAKALSISDARVRKLRIDGRLPGAKEMGVPGFIRPNWQT